MKTLFLSEKSFSTTGPVEKAARLAAMALFEVSTESGGEFIMFGRDDLKKANAQPYLPERHFNCYGTSRRKFFFQSLRAGKISSIVVLGHYNLLLLAYLIKLMSPNVKIILLAQVNGIPSRLSRSGRYASKCIDWIVSDAGLRVTTKGSFSLFPAEKIIEINLCLDPFMPQPPGMERRNEFRSSYGFQATDLVLMTLHQNRDLQGNNGIEKICIAIKKLQPVCPGIKILCVGAFDENEKKELDTLIFSMGLEDDVIFTGFVPDRMLCEYYNMADIYIISNEREVLGFRFLEALYYKKRIISPRTREKIPYDPDTFFIDIDSQEGIAEAILHMYNCEPVAGPGRKQLLEYFSFSNYKEKWKNTLEAIHSGLLPSKTISTVSATG